MTKATIQLETLACPSCMQKIESSIKQVPGVDPDSVKVLFNSSKVKALFDESQANIEDIEQAIQKISYQVLKSTVK